MIFEAFASASVEGPDAPKAQEKVLVLQDLPLLVVAAGNVLTLWNSQSLMLLKKKPNASQIPTRLTRLPRDKQS